MNGGESYNVNFFKPTTPFLKENIKAIIIGLVIWGVATYGFQILLKIVETPTPEQGYLVYEKVYPKLKQGDATPEEKKDIAVVYLSLIGKAIPLQKNVNLKSVFTATVNDILPEGLKADFAAAAAAVQNDKTVDLGFVENALGIQDNIALKSVLPFAVTQMDKDVMTLVNAEIPPIMDKYLIHNQSFLTDTIFLGFPFHYFYTALFLLTLFVVICLVYCRVIDTIMKKYEMESAYE
jgi:uncharacterized membrane protein